MKQTNSIQDIKPQHAPQLRRLFKRAVAEDFSYFPTTYRTKVLRDNSLPRLVAASLRPARILLGAYQANRLTGYAIAGTNGDQLGKLYWLYVSPEGRGQRLGSVLLEKALERMRRRGMERVSLVTHNYGDYYLRHGFALDRAEQLYGVEMNVMSYQWLKQS